MKNSDDTIGNRTSDLPACSAVVDEGYLGYSTGGGVQDVRHVFRRYCYRGSSLRADVGLLSERVHLEVVTVLWEV